jgi:hypothetical protein
MASPKAAPGDQKIKTAAALQARRKVMLASLRSQLMARGWSPGAVAGWDEEETDLWYMRLIEAGTTSALLPLAAVSVEYLRSLRPDTVRGNMYRVVSDKTRFLPDTGPKSYACIQRLLNRLRMKRVVPFEWVVDNVRETIKPSSWSGLADYASTVALAYRKNFWASLPEYIELIVEKDAVAGTVSSVTEEFDVPLHPIRGYNSTTFCWKIARRWRRIKKPITIYYVGDHDPSGRDMERDIKEKLTNLSDGKEFKWKRLAVVPDDFKRYKIKPLAPKKKDKRTKTFVAEWGRDCAEVEAIPATDLRDTVRNAILSHIPSGEWERLEEVERLEREQWDAYMKAMPGAEDDEECDDEE